MKQSRVRATIELLRKNKFRRVGLPELQRAAGAQHGARLKEIRDLGYIVRNETEHVAGEVHSCYVLVAEPREAIAGGRLFADDAPLRHRDDG